MKKWTPTMKSRKPIGYSIQYSYLIVQLAESIRRYKIVLEKGKRAEQMKGGRKHHLLMKYQYLREGERYNLNILSCALMEALINTWLALKTTDEQFKILERAQIKEKWVTVPSIYLKKYRIDKTSRLFECLSFIIEMRNFIVHMKPMLIGVNRSIRKGNYDDKHSKEKLKPDEYLSTPVHLWANLFQYEKDPHITGLMLPFTLDFQQYKHLIRKDFDITAI